MNKTWSVLLSVITLAGTGGVFKAVTAADNPDLLDQATGNHLVADSDEVTQHIHSVGLRQADVDALLASLPDGGSVTFESSVGYSGGVANNGMAHSHAVVLTKANLNQLKNSGTVVVQSEQALGHTHMFRFFNQQQCAAMATPIPSPSQSASPSVSPLPFPSRSVVPTPSGQPSAPPTPITSGTPIPTPSMS